MKVKTEAKGEKPMQYGDMSQSMRTDFKTQDYARKWILSKNLHKEHRPTKTLILAQLNLFQTSGLQN